MKRWFLAAALVAVGCSKAPSEDQCKQLLDHLVELELKRTGATATADSQKAGLAEQKAKVAESKWPDYEAACREKTARDRVECALAATDLDGVAKCDDEK
jgi:uncharacterized protein (DUF885 family)